MVSAFTAPIAYADILPVAGRADLHADDGFDWARVGSEGLYASPLVVASDGGSLDVTASNAGLDFRRYDQGSGWVGTFDDGDALLYTYLNDGRLDLMFSRPVFAVGTQVQTNWLGDFEAHMQAFDAAGTSLGEVSVAGVSQRGPGLSPPLLGLESDGVGMCGSSCGRSSRRRPGRRSRSRSTAWMSGRSPSRRPSSCSGPGSCSGPRDRSGDGESDRAGLRIARRTGSEEVSRRGAEVA